MENFLGVESIGAMPAYGTAHLWMLALTAAATVAVVPVCRRLRHEYRVTRAAGWALLVLTVAWTGFWLLPGNFNVNESLPFHFSDALRFITAIALITRAGWAVMVSYCWGLTLNSQSILTPDLNYFAFPALEFTGYWALHIINWLVPVALVWGLGYRPTWRGYRTVLVVTAAWLGLAHVVNLIAGSNYGYTTHTPAGGSALDLLGPWPVYILVGGVILATAWALLTWPWTTDRFTSRSVPVGSGLLRRARVTSAA